MQFDAVSETTSISFLTNHKIRLDRMLARCYDGASVMSGAAMMQERMQERLGIEESRICTVSTVTIPAPSGSESCRVMR